MAHEIQIPTSFEFRTARIKWEPALATVIGWIREPGERENPVHLSAEISTASGHKRNIGLPLGGLPEKYRKRSLETLKTKLADDAVKALCSDLQLRYFVHDSNTYIRDSELRQHSQTSDAWQLRDDFLGLKSDDEAIVAFLNKWGRWIPYRNFVDLAEISALQAAVKDALISPAKVWFRSRYASPPAINSRSAEFPYFVILTDACEAAIRTTTTIDLLRELKFKECARPDCAKPFSVTSKHERSYCTTYCAHLESVRRSRKSAAIQRSK
jgi:hypothetical protein